MLKPGLIVADRYRVEQEIGRGGMGVVHGATRLADGRPVALKIVRVPLDGDDAARRRLLREARAAAAVGHPNVVEVFEVFEWNPGPPRPTPVPVLAMERLEGETLAARLVNTGALSLSTAATLLLPIVSAVGHAHARGVIHRDLKPENLFVITASGTEFPKVLDFGVAKLCSPVWNLSTLTHRDAVIGTPLYMAPEQITDGGNVDHRADVWALGAVLYECLTGACPVSGETPAQVLRAVLDAAITPIAVVASVPEEIADIVGGMLERNANHRPTLREVGVVLSRSTEVEVESFGPPSSQLELGDDDEEPIEEAPNAVGRRRL